MATCTHIVELILGQSTLSQILVQNEYKCVRLFNTFLMARSDGLRKLH